MSDPNTLAVESLAQTLMGLLQDLLDQPLPADASVVAAQAHALAQSLCLRLAPKQPASLIDRAVFDALLTVAGDDTAPKLLEQVLLDLHGVHQALDRALPVADWAELRLQSHILMSIAGSFGAMQLCRDAETLNRLAHATDETGLATVDLALRQGLAGLVQFLHDEAARLDAPRQTQRPPA